MLRVRTNYVAVVPMDDPDVSASGRIIIPDEAKDRTDQGVVKYVGPDCRDVRPLDYVIYGGHNGQLLLLNRGTAQEERLIIVQEDYISAYVHTEDINELEIPGLYFYSKRDLDYEDATYGLAIQFLKDAIESSSWFSDKQRWNVREVTEKSRKSQYRIMADSRE